MSDKNVLEVVREYFPGMSDDAAEHVLWSRTGWPSFWAGDPETCMRTQLAEFAMALKRGTPLCDWCNADAEPGETVCRTCDAALTEAALTEEEWG